MSLYSIVADDSKIQVEFKSDVNTDTDRWPYIYMARDYGNELLDMQLGETEMRVREILNKAVEVFSSD